MRFPEGAAGKQERKQHRGPDLCQDPDHGAVAYLRPGRNGQKSLFVKRDQAMKLTTYIATIPARVITTF